MIETCALIVLEQFGGRQAPIRIAGKKLVCAMSSKLKAHLQHFAIFQSTVQGVYFQYCFGYAMNVLLTTIY